MLNVRKEYQLHTIPQISLLYFVITVVWLMVRKDLSPQGANDKAPSNTQACSNISPWLKKKKLVYEHRRQATR